MIKKVFVNKLIRPKKWFKKVKKFKVEWFHEFEITMKWGSIRICFQKYVKGKFIHKAFHASYQATIHICIEYINFMNTHLNGQLKLLDSQHSSPISTLAPKPSFHWPPSPIFTQATKPSFHTDPQAQFSHWPLNLVLTGLTFFYLASKALFSLLSN